MGAIKEVLVPDIGDFKDVEVIEVLVGPGDAIQKEQSLITLESDKATMEIPSPTAGVVKELRIKVGDKISQGATILMVEQDATPADKPAPEKKEKAKQKKQEQERPAASAPATVTVPDIGDFKDVEVIEVLVKAGDAVAKEQSLITLESDKATMEIPSPTAGVVKEIKVKVGDKVSEGSPVLIIESGQGAPAARAAEPAPAKAPSPAPVASAPIPRPGPVPAEPQEAATTRPHASPSVRKFARELGVDLTQVRGSGPKERVLHDDVQAFVKGVMTQGAAAAQIGRAHV